MLKNPNLLKQQDIFPHEIILVTEPGVRECVNKRVFVEHFM